MFVSNQNWLRSVHVFSLQLWSFPFQDRGVTLAEFSTEDQRNLDPLLLTNLESCHPSNAKVFLNDKGQLEWPVMFLYPEHGESDIITAFNEQAK